MKLRKKERVQLLQFVSEEKDITTKEAAICIGNMTAREKRTLVAKFKEHNGKVTNQMG